MPGKDTKVDPLPEEFASEDEAAEFWDTHSISDYEEFLEPADLEIAIKRRHFEIEVDEESFLALRETARRQRKPVRQLASEILKQNLAPA
jgi:predicted DNA binding CopG/RHH family protein